MFIGKDLVAASATPIVLGILAEGESYGYAILKRVNDLSGGRITWTDGMLYPLLHRLERLGLVEASWGEGPTGRRRKHYALTREGHAALAEQRSQWQAVTATLDGLWTAIAHAPPAPPPPPGGAGPAATPSVYRPGAGGGSESGGK